MRRMIRVALLALALLLTTPSFAATAEPARTYLLSHSGYGLCTTWPTMQKGYMGWLTDMHCVVNASGEPDMEGLFVIDGIPASIVRAEGDLALLSGGPGRALPFQIAKRLPDIGEDVVMRGRPYGGPEVFFRGWVSAYDIPVMGRSVLFQFPGAPGVSGSVVLNTRGQAIGIVQSAPARKASASVR